MWVAFYTRINMNGGVVRTEVRSTSKRTATLWFYYWNVWYCINPFSAKQVSLYREEEGVTFLKDVRGMSQNVEKLRSKA